MLFKDLLTEENKNVSTAYSVVVEEADVDNCDKISNELKEIGLVFQSDNDGMIAEHLLDILISLKVKNLYVTLEIPSSFVVDGLVDVKYILQMASNIDISVAFLPHSHKLDSGKINSEDYKNVILSALTNMLEKPNFEKFVFPISSFLEYLMLERILGKEALVDFRPENEYIKEHFANIMTKEDSDYFKSAIRQEIYKFYGGEEEFNLVASTMIESLMDKSKSMFTHDVSEYHKNNSPKSTS